MNDLIEYCYNEAKLALLVFKINLKLTNPNDWYVRDISLNELEKDLEVLNENTRRNN